MSPCFIRTPWFSLEDESEAEGLDESEDETENMGENGDEVEGKNKVQGQGQCMIA